MDKVVHLKQEAEAPLHPIAFIDLKAQQARIRPQIEAAVMGVLDHGAYVMGPEITQFEEDLIAYTGAADAVGCSSGTDALVIAMMGEEIGAGHAVFIPAFTYNATANAVIMMGATPVFVDIEKETFNIDPQDLEKRIAEVKSDGKLTPKAIVGVDLFGRPADYAALQAIADSESMVLMADAAQSFGGAFDGKMVGAAAPITGTSFFPAKGLGGYGDGGAIFTTDKEKGELWRSLRFHGTDASRKLSVRVGMNGRLDTFQAAILIEKLKIYEDEWHTRQRAASIYLEGLEGVVGLPAADQRMRSSWGLFSVLLNEGTDRAGLQAALKEDGIPSAVYYSHPLHVHPAFEAYAPAGGLPVCEICAEHILALPMHPYLSEAQAQFIVERLKAHLAG